MLAASKRLIVLSAREQDASIDAHRRERCREDPQSTQLCRWNHALECPGLAATMNVGSMR